MIAWQSRLAGALADPGAPPVLPRDLLRRFARSAREGQAVPESTLTWWIRNAAATGQLQAVQRGLYLNRFRNPPGQLADAISFFHRDGVVSLNTVLGDVGVLNNPSRIVTAVVPIDAGFPAPKLGRRRSLAGTLHFYGMPRRILEAGTLADRLEPSRRFEHLRATPEKALLDWLYLGRSSRSRRTPPPPDDIDMDLLDQRRLRRLAKAAQLVDALARWREGRCRFA
jgi:hypothetical protein